MKIIINIANPNRLLDISYKLDAFIKVASGKVFDTNRGYCMHYFLGRFKEHFGEFNLITNENRRVPDLSFYCIERNHTKRMGKR